MLQTGQINFSPALRVLAAKSADFSPSSDSDIPTTTLQTSASSLLKISSIFPFDLAPDIVIVDQDKVNIINNDVSGMQNVTSVLLENISHVDVNTGFLAATLHLIDSTNERNPIDILVHSLKNDDALKARMLIQGLITSRKHLVKLPEDPGTQEKQAEQLGSSGELLPNVQNEENIKAPGHYYGDLIRILLITGAVVMLITLPLFHFLTNLPLSLSILAILGLVVLAGSISPKYMIVIYFESIISVVLFWIFENMAVEYFVWKSNFYFGLVNQILAIIFFAATYFSIKTVRGFSAGESVNLKVRG